MRRDDGNLVEQFVEAGDGCGKGDGDFVGRGNDRHYFAGSRTKCISGRGVQRWIHQLVHRVLHVVSAERRPVGEAEGTATHSQVAPRRETGLSANHNSKKPLAYGSVWDNGQRRQRLLSLDASAMHLSGLFSPETGGKRALRWGLPTEMTREDAREAVGTSPPRFVSDSSIHRGEAASRRGCAPEMRPACCSLHGLHDRSGFAAPKIGPCRSVVLTLRHR